jgi:hypothetical protein
MSDTPKTVQITPERLAQLEAAAARDAKRRERYREYRREYDKRPERVAYRKAYQKKRYHEMKALLAELETLKAQLAEGGEE